MENAGRSHSGSDESDEISEGKKRMEPMSGVELTAGMFWRILVHAYRSLSGVFFMPATRKQRYVL
jgi:hypothetical protein